MYSYTGIGSRRTPEEALLLMWAFSYHASVEGWTVRSGHADGADAVFERAIIEKQVEVYLPWASFNGGSDYATLTQPRAEAYEIARRFHPAWKYLRHGAKALHARNVHQILGKDLNDPSYFVVCWTPDGSLDGYGPDTGGTGQALRIASHYRIPVWNIQRPDHFEEVRRVVVG